MSLWFQISILSNKRNKKVSKFAPRDDMSGMSARDGGSAGPLYGQTRSSSGDGRCCVGIIIAIIIIVVIIIAYNKFF